MKFARPPRRAWLSPRHDWGTQSVQYDRDDIPRTPGIVQWAVPASEAPVRIECLLFWNPGNMLLGILNYFPEGSPFSDEPHDVFLIVNPVARRCGIGTDLLKAALRRWPEIDLAKQSYTDEGWDFVSIFLEWEEN